VAEVSITLRIAGEPKSVAFTAPEEPVTPAELLPVFRQFSNAMVEAAEAKSPVSCRAGCGTCCRQLVPIREMEAAALAALVDAMPEPRRAAVRARFADAVERSALLRERLDARGALDRAGRVQLKLDFFALGIACPFLENESCSIHPDRPLICREHLVNTPAEWCADPAHHPIRALPIVRADTAVANLFEGGRWVPLIDALTYAPHSAAEPSAARPMVESFVRALISQAAE